MSPLGIEILIHYYARANEYQNITSPAQNQLIEDFVADGLLVQSCSGVPRKYQITKRGSVYVESLLKVPYPIQIWVTPPINGAV